MGLTAKYTLYVFLVFVAILVLSFYSLTVKADSQMERLASNMIYTTVSNLSDIISTKFDMLPYLATHKEGDIEWLQSNYMYFGGNTVNLDYEYINEDNEWFIKFSGEFETFRINEAKVNLYLFFRDVLVEKVKIKGGYFYVLDSLGNVVFHSIKERIGLNVYDEKMEFLLEKFEKEKSGYIEYSYKGDSIIAFFKEVNLPFKLLYYDEEGNEKEVKFYFVNAMSLSNLRQHYSGFVNFMYFIILPILIGVTTLASYWIAKISVKPIKNQSNIIRNFSKELYDTFSNLSTSAAEMEKIAENNHEIARKLSEVTQNFATSVEEGRYEVDASLKSINAFIDLLSKVNEEIASSVNLIESLTDLNDRIAYLSDTISVLAINASIESSKERIDREGIAKIVEHITSIAGEARETSRRTKKTIEAIQKSLSQLALYSERVRKEGDVISSAIDNIKKVMEDFVKGITYIKGASENLSHSSEETSVGVEDIANSIDQLKSAMDKLTSMIQKLKL